MVKTNIKMKQQRRRKVDLNVQKGVLLGKIDNPSQTTVVEGQTNITILADE